MDYFNFIYRVHCAYSSFEFEWGKYSVHIQIIVAEQKQTFCNQNGAQKVFCAYSFLRTRRAYTKMHRRNNCAAIKSLFEPFSIEWRTIFASSHANLIRTVCLCFLPDIIYCYCYDYCVWHRDRRLALKLDGTARCNCMHQWHTEQRTVYEHFLLFFLISLLDEIRDAHCCAWRQLTAILSLFAWHCLTFYKRISCVLELHYYYVLFAFPFWVCCAQIECVFSWFCDRMRMLQISHKKIANH